MQQAEVMRVLDEPLSQALLRSSIPARLAYTGRDGARAIPIAFDWSGAQFVVCTPPHAAKVAALRADPRVALTIDTNAFPPHVLLVRGTASVEQLIQSVDRAGHRYAGPSHPVTHRSILSAPGPVPGRREPDRLPAAPAPFEREVP